MEIKNTRRTLIRLSTQAPAERRRQGVYGSDLVAYQTKAVVEHPNNEGDKYLWGLARNST